MWSIMCEKTIKMFDGKVFGMKVSDYGLENGYLDYYTLSEIIGDMVLNNNIFIRDCDFHL